MPQRFQGVTLLRDDGTATYQLASVVDDIDFGITHVIRGSDHRPNEELHRGLARALGAEPPEYLHFGLVLGPDGKKMSKRAEGASIAALREEGIPPEAVRGLPRGARDPEARRPLRPAPDPLARRRRDRGAPGRRARRPGRGAGRRRPGAARRPRPERGGRAGADDPRAAGQSRCRTSARRSSASASSAAGSANGLDRDAAKAIVRELKAVGGHLRAVRQALTGRESGPELWAVLAALPRDETLRRVDAAL